MYKIIQLEIHRDERGDLVAIENSTDIPFCIKRIFFMFNVKQIAKRAQHANMKAQALMICLNGCCDMLLDDEKGQQVNIQLNRKDQGAYIEPKTWIEMSNFSKDCLVLVMSDYYYDRKHQIRDYQEFSEAVK